MATYNIISPNCNIRLRIKEGLIVIIITCCTLPAIMAQSNCTSDENCQFNEFCDLGLGNCNVCISCEFYNRNSTNVECPREVLPDCGPCLSGYSLKNETDEQVCQLIDFADVQPTGTNSTVPTGSNSTVLEYDDFDKIRPWLYVGAAVTLFILFGTCGVVGSKVYMLPRQQKLRAALRQQQSLEKAEANSRKTKQDSMSASKEERERLYPDLSKLTPRTKPVKNVQESSY